MSLLRMELDTFLAICTEAGTPVSYRLSLAAKRGDWRALVSERIRPSTYTCPKTLFYDLQVVGFLKKHPGLPLGVDREAAAIKLFWKSERQCYDSNERLAPLLEDPGYYGAPVERLLFNWRKKISRVLRQAPNWDQLTERLRFGPGATFRNTGLAVPMAYKLSDGYTRTSRTDCLLPDWKTTSWCRNAARGELSHVVEFTTGELGCSIVYDTTFAKRDFELVRGNRFTTVPKDALKDRGICIEPSLNVAYQLAVGSVLTSRMRHGLGWSKGSAQEYHKLLARLGSLTGAISTIDLSSASDTVCYNLVKLLLPPDWLCLLDTLRSPYTLIEGRWVKLEKFSSMGNGYTFELETLLFYTLSLAVSDLVGVREDLYTPGLAISVFGDDIIVPTSVSKTLLLALEFAGFEANEEKTFTTGRFRESCGGDYYSGHDVRPFHLKEELNEPHRLISLANGLYRAGDRARFFHPRRGFIRAWFEVLDALPVNIRRLRGPTALGDLTITDDEWVQRGCWRERNGIRWVNVWRPVTWGELPYAQFRPGVVLTLAVFNCRFDTLAGTVLGTFEHRRETTVERLLTLLARGAPNPRNGVPIRKDGSYVRGYKIGRVPYS